MRLEVRSFGIEVAIIAPGDLRTPFTTHRQNVTTADSPYAAQARATLAVMEADEQRGPPPDVVAHLLGELVAARRLQSRYVVGMMSQRAAVAAKRWLPARLFESVFANLYEL